jgi:transposase
VLEDREKTTVVAWLRQNVENRLLSELGEVTTDMWDGYVQAVREVFGDSVRITIDRFHVMYNFQQGLTRARREIQRQLPAEAAQALKGTRWLWTTNPENLDEEQRQDLARLGKQYPALGLLAGHRESLRQIFEDRGIRTAEEGRRRLLAWCERGKQLGLSALERFNRTLLNWLDKIANYFVSRSSNGPTEGFNHGIRAILWRTFGMSNFKRFRLRVLHAFG